MSGVITVRDVTAAGRNRGQVNDTRCMGPAKALIHLLEGQLLDDAVVSELSSRSIAVNDGLSYTNYSGDGAGMFNLVRIAANFQLLSYEIGLRNPLAIDIYTARSHSTLNSDTLADVRPVVAQRSAVAGSFDLQRAQSQRDQVAYRPWL